MVIFKIIFRVFIETFRFLFAVSVVALTIPILFNLFGLTVGFEKTGSVCKDYNRGNVKKWQQLAFPAYKYSCSNKPILKKYSQQIQTWLNQKAD